MKLKSLTIKDLQETKPNTIFAWGNLIDNANHINLANTGKEVRWVAVRGDIDDWAIYAQNPHYVNSVDHDVISFGLGGVWDNDKIARVGDKVHDSEHIRKLVLCDDEAFKRYRH